MQVEDKVDNNEETPNKNVLSSLRARIEDRLALSDSYKHVFSSVEGKRVLRHLMNQCGLLNPKIVIDTNLLLVHQGQRQIVLSILNIIGKDNNKIIEEIEESLQQE